MALLPLASGNFSFARIGHLIRLRHMLAAQIEQTSKGGTSAPASPPLGALTPPCRRSTGACHLDGQQSGRADSQRAVRHGPAGVSGAGYSGGMGPTIALIVRTLLCCGLIGGAVLTWAQPMAAGGAPLAPPLPYSVAVAARFPDPVPPDDTPVLPAGAVAFTDNAALAASLAAVAASAPAGTTISRLVPGRSQDGSAIEALHFTRGPGRPAVLLIGQQHGDEPAGAEALLVDSLCGGWPSRGGQRHQQAIRLGAVQTSAKHAERCIHGRSDHRRPENNR